MRRYVYFGGRKSRLSLSFPFILVYERVSHRLFCCMFPHDIIGGKGDSPLGTDLADRTFQDKGPLSFSCKTLVFHVYKEGSPCTNVNQLSPSPAGNPGCH